MSDEILGPTEAKDDISQMSDAELDAALAAEIPSAISEQGIANDIKDYEKYGDSPFRTAAESAADAATFGLSSQFQTKVLGVPAEDIAKRAEFNPGANVFGTVTGIGVPLIASGGTSAVAKGVATAGKAVIAAERASAKISDAILKKIIKESTNKKLTKELIAKSVAKGAGTAAEGAAYGAGELIREDALGTADFNKENLLAYTGSGALLGGTLGSAIPLAGAATSKIGEGSRKLLSNTLEKYADPVKNLKALSGMTDSQWAKQLSKNKNFEQDALNHFRVTIGMKPLDNEASIISKNLAAKKAAVKDMDSVYDAVEGVALPKSTLTNTFSKLEDELIKPYEGLKSFKSQIAPVRRIVDDLKSMANKEGTITAKDLRGIRQKMDELAKSYFKSLDPSKGAEAAGRARTLLRDEINDAITAINPVLGDKLKIANKTYSMSTIFEKGLEKKSLKDKDILSFKDYVLGGILGAGFGPGALLIPAAKKLIESDLKRRVVVLNAIQKSNNAVESKLSTSAKNFLTATKKTINPLGVKALMSSPLAYKDNKAPESKQQAYKNISEKVTELVMNPEAFEKNVSRSLYNISKAAPQTADAMLIGSQKTLQFLRSKLPKNQNPLTGPKFMAREYTPSSMELSKFERYVQILDNPLSALDELESGNLTREHVEVLQQVYPDLYARIQQEVSQAVADEETMDYGKKIQLGILLNIDTDVSLISENVLALQANFAPQEQEAASPSAPAVNSTQTGVSKIDMADRAETPVQATITRES